MGQIIKVHNASQIPMHFIDVGVVLGIVFCILGLLIVIYTSKYYR
jgi:hypothetical protein